MSHPDDDAPELAGTPLTPVEAGEQPLHAAAEQPADGVAAESAAAAEPPAVAEPPASAAVPRPPVPRPGPRPAPPPSPAQVRRAAAPTPPVPAAAPASDPTPWGRVTDDGTVYVRTADDERPVGSFPDAGPQAALAYFGRRYDELAGQVALLAARLQTTDVPVQDARRTLKHLRQQVAEAPVVGDLAALGSRLDEIEALARDRGQQADRARAAARDAALAERAAIVTEAEEIVAVDPERVQWRPAGNRLSELLEAWKTAQRTGPRLGRGDEDPLWKRFNHARTTFDRNRRHHFSKLAERNAQAKALKEVIVAEAQALSGSTEWRPTSSAYRSLMDRWKAAGRAERREDDALWTRFRAAQDAFFDARTAANAEQDSEFRANLQVKEALLAEAEALLPVKDAGTARAGLRSIQERWESAGKVPRADMGRLEQRMRAVETAVREADQNRWRRSNPEVKARADSATAQLEASIEALRADVAAAEASGDDRARRRAQEALDARSAWLEQVRRAAADVSG